MSSYLTQADHPEWQRVLEQLRSMQQMLVEAGQKPMHLNHFAESFAGLARAYLAAIKSEGRTSMRAEAVVKALDLKTPKSKLEAFLDIAS